jgi:DNA polymerase III epsilon subunit-like protein
MLSLLSHENKYNFSKYLKLDKPLIIFDTETTGLILSMDKIIELGYVKINNDGKIIKDDLYFNPEIEISEESIAVHGITNEQVKDKPTFKKRQKNYGKFSKIAITAALMSSILICRC